MAQQNLVLNPSFETVSSCPNLHSQFSKCVNWINPTYNTPDVYSNCQANSPVFVPNNLTGFQYARTGNNYAAIVIYNSFYPLEREYIEATLSDTLLKETKYQVEFYVNRNDLASLVLSHIGAYFTRDSVKVSTLYSLPDTPQYLNSTSLITDSINWTKISGTYVAQGGEKYVTIGFFDSSGLDTLQISGPYCCGAYYFIDDVSVTLHDSISTLNELNEKFHLDLFPNPVKDILHFKNLNVQASISLTIENLLGEKLIERKMNENQINIADLKPGVYLVKLKDSKGNFVAKFLKE